MSHTTCAYRTNGDGVVAAAAAGCVGGLGWVGGLVVPVASGILMPDLCVAVPLVGPCPPPPPPPHTHTGGGLPIGVLCR